MQQQLLLYFSGNFSSDIDDYDDKSPPTAARQRPVVPKHKSAPKVSFIFGQNPATVTNV